MGGARGLSSGDCSGAHPQSDGNGLSEHAVGMGCWGGRVSRLGHAMRTGTVDLPSGPGRFQARVVLLQVGWASSFFSNSK
jgi:hypothetical protein